MFALETDSGFIQFATLAQGIGLIKSTEWKAGKMGGDQDGPDHGDRRLGLSCDTDGTGEQNFNFDL
jgi:hypothetical protein